MNNFSPKSVLMQKRIFFPLDMLWRGAKAILSEQIPTFHILAFILSPLSHTYCLIVRDGLYLFVTCIYVFMFVICIYVFMFVICIYLFALSSLAFVCSLIRPAHIAGLREKEKAVVSSWVKFTPVPPTVHSVTNFNTETKELCFFSSTEYPSPLLL